ncbi:MAG: NAD-dependent succinate-semialdehyde dehydrogenase [Legionellaceae bacterium]|nr:NAD-dependent succinate-semialdehyde dehydrogenase [Legionellaceae bacterium]
MKFNTINPDTGEVINSYTAMSSAEVSQKIEDAHLAFKLWRKKDVAERKKFMLSIADKLIERKDELAGLIAQEMGKPISLGRLEIEKCALVVQHYANCAEEYLKPEIIKTNMKKSMVCYQPLGVLFAIMPWNFPFWQVFRFLAPNIMAGNVVILKHAPNVFGCANAIASLFKQVSFPKDIFQNFIIDTDLAAEVIANDKIAGVTLTGSEKAGASISTNASSHLKKSVLELGGSDPYIVLKDAELDNAAKNIVKSRLSNSGQVCISAKRIIAVEEIFDKLVLKIENLVKEYKVGNPFDENTQCGPLARADLRDLVHKQVLESIDCGANLLLGGVIPKGRGFYYPPTILTNVKPGMPAFDDEIFGPVLAIISATDESSAINLANQSRFGLSSAIFTQDLERGEYLAINEIEAGSCYVNSMTSSNPLLPFGGIKKSGFGRELSKEGFLEFMNIKTIGICE